MPSFSLIRHTCTLQELRVRAYLDLLQERDSRGLPAAPGPAAGGEAGQADIADQAPSDDGPGPADPGPADPGPADPGPGGPGGPTPGHGAGAGPSLAALVTITIPAATWHGRSETPGQAGGFGSLDGDDARDLAAAAVRHPATRWCLTAVNPDGTAAAHGCPPGRHPPPGTGPPPGHSVSTS
jgi:hypothetical protein